MKNKTIKILIEKSATAEGYYIDLYVGYTRITTKIAKNEDELIDIIQKLNNEIKGLGFKKKGA